MGPVTIRVRVHSANHERSWLLSNDPIMLYSTIGSPSVPAMAKTADEELIVESTGVLDYDVVALCSVVSFAIGAVRTTSFSPSKVSSAPRE